MDWIGKRDAFTNNSRNLGVPCLLRGAAIQQRVSDLNVYASANTGVHTGLHLETGNLEFWGWDYIQANARAVPNARDDLYQSLRK